MKKSKIIGLVIVGIILISLIAFVSFNTFDDGLLKIEGKVVKVPSATLQVEDCNKENKNVAYCEKNIKVNNNDAKFVFAYQDFKENGYPRTLTVSINNHEFLKKENLNLEASGSSEYSIFNNFKVIDKYIAFTYMDGTDGRKSTLYVIDLEGNIVLEEYDIDEDDMKLKDSTTYIKYEDKSIEVYATRLVQDILYHDKHICKASAKDIVEAHYIYTLKDGKFTKKQTKKITAKEFIENKKIDCTSVK